MRVAPRIRRWVTGSRSDPSTRFRYLTEVEGRARTDPEVIKARKAIGRSGWAASLLESQLPDGQWAAPGTSAIDIMRPRFASTHWVALVLADLGMTRSDPRIQRTSEIILTWRRKVLAAKDGELCITGNATRTLIRFGYLDHPVVRKSIDWLVQAQKPDGGWTCYRRTRAGTLDGWEALAALAEIPDNARTDPARRAIERGAEFYLSRHLQEEGGDRYAPRFRIHYPNHFYYDLLVGLRILNQLGYARDPRLRPALKWLVSKRGMDGTWALDGVHPVTDLEDGVYVFRQPIFPLMLESLGVPSQWATVEALSILTHAGVS
jgi:squalene cyclase